MFSFGYNSKTGTIIRALLAIVLGLVMIFGSDGHIARFVVSIIGFCLLAFGALQLVVLSGTMRLLGGGFLSLILPAIALACGILLIFNPFSMSVMSIIAGVSLILYGISEFSSLNTVRKAKVEYEIRNHPDDRTKSEGGIKSDLSNVKDVEYEKIDD